MSNAYEDFLARKLTRELPTGIPGPHAISSALFPFQRDLVSWALRRGRCAIFADTGLGKTRMEIEWARHVAAHTGRPVLILAPLAVAAQTSAEGERIGVPVKVCREQAHVAPGVNVANYERLHRFAPEAFGGVVCDESSCIKHHDAKTLKQLMDAFGRTPFRLCATATPSPNDYTELGTHAEFLGICSRAEMLSEFFVHDGGDTSSWRLKGHARGAFWRFVASWGALVRRPSDLGYPDDGYILPPLSVEHHEIAADRSQAERVGLLFAKDASTLMERRAARKASLSGRVAACVGRANADSEPWVVWTDLNAESAGAAREILGAVEVTGAMPIDEKEAALGRFVGRKSRVLVTKPSIAGFGLNLQFCARMAFIGVTDSWEAYYQAVRRCYRFGQRRPVEVHIFTSELEGAVTANLARKEADALRMAEDLSAETRAVVREEVCGQERVTNDYAPARRMEIPAWLSA